MLPLADVSFRLDGSGLDTGRFLLSSVNSSTNSLLLAGKLCLQLTLAQLLLGSTVTFQISRPGATTWGSGGEKLKVRGKRHSYNKHIQAHGPDPTAVPLCYFSTSTYSTRLDLTQYGLEGFPLGVPGQFLELTHIPNRYTNVNITLLKV